MVETYPAFAGTETFYGALALAHTLVAVIDQLPGAIRQALGAPDVKGRLVSLGADVVGSTPTEALKYSDTQVRQWDKMLKEVRIQGGLIA